MKNTKFLVLFLIIFVSLAVYAQDATDPENPDSETPDQDTAEQTDQDAEVPDTEEPEQDNGKGNMIGGEPAKSWEDGGQDFFVMFNSNIDNKIKLAGEDTDNPQGDTCVDSSSFTLNKFHIPDDAIIEAIVGKLMEIQDQDGAPGWERCGRLVFRLTISNA